jgi:hypothetical protein
MNKNLVLFYLFALALFVRCASTPAEYKPNYKTPPFIIDSHIHYIPTDEWEKSLVEIYTKHHAMACVLVDLNNLEKGIAFAKAHPEIVIPYAAVKIDSASVLQDIQRAYDMGYKGTRCSLGRLWLHSPFSHRLHILCKVRSARGRAYLYSLLFVCTTLLLRQQIQHRILPQANIVESN